jgi:hypothetical protein
VLGSDSKDCEKLENSGKTAPRKKHYTFCQYSAESTNSLSKRYHLEEEQKLCGTHENKMFHLRTTQNIQTANKAYVNITHNILMYYKKKSSY